jgi:2-methylcitrate dehydratase PrpD
LTKKFRLKCNEEYEKAYPDSWGAEVKVRLINGKELSVRRKHAKGDPEAQLSSKEMRDKAEILFRYGGVSDVESWVERILELSYEPSFRESDLIRLLNVSSKGSGNKSSK